MSGECVISLVLSCHSKDLKWWTSVTALLQQNFIWQARQSTWRQADPKGEASIHLLFLLLYIHLLHTLSLDYANWLAMKRACLFHLNLVFGFSLVPFLWVFFFILRIIKSKEHKLSASYRTNMKWWNRNKITSINAPIQKRRVRKTHSWQWSIVPYPGLGPCFLVRLQFYFRGRFSSAVFSVALRSDLCSLTAQADLPNLSFSP